MLYKELAVKQFFFLILLLKVKQLRNISVIVLFF